MIKLLDDPYSFVVSRALAVLKNCTGAVGSRCDGQARQAPSRDGGGCGEGSLGLRATIRLPRLHCGSF